MYKLDRVGSHVLFNSTQAHWVDKFPTQLNPWYLVLEINQAAQLIGFELWPFCVAL